MSTTDETGPGPADSRTLEFGLSGRTVTIERVSGRKASSAFAIIRGISGKVPALVHKWGEFQAEYERTHTTEVDRTMALVRYGPRPLVDEAGFPLRYPDTIAVGEGDQARTEPHPHAGDVVMAPSPLESMADEAWAAQGNVMRMPRSPSWGESAIAVLPDILEEAEDHLYRLLALFTMSNGDVKSLRASGDLRAELERQGDELAEEYLDDIFELAVACGDVVDGTFRRKAAALAERGGMGNVLRLLGLNPEAFQAKQKEAPQTPEEATQTDQEEPTPTSPSTTGQGTPPSSTPTSSGDSGTSASEDGPPSTSHMTSSRPSVAEPTPTVSG